jgi:2-polyprenyl-6-methoxyphenol hydroxylase-like FAD-dependent oxidoreductase
VHSAQGVTTDSTLRMADVGAEVRPLAGMLLSHLLAASGVESVIVEARTEEHVLARIRAGILDHSSVELLRSAGLGQRLDQIGIEHRGVYLQSPGERHHLDFVDRVGRGVWVYGQTEVQKDLVAARPRRLPAHRLQRARRGVARLHHGAAVRNLHGPRHTSAPRNLL